MKINNRNNFIRILKFAKKLFLFMKGNFNVLLHKHVCIPKYGEYHFIYNSREASMSQSMIAIEKNLSLSSALFSISGTLTLLFVPLSMPSIT